MRLALNESRIMWPGRLQTKPEGFMIPTHLKVLTIEEKPFVYVRKADAESCLQDEIPCPHFNATDHEREQSQLTSVHKFQRKFNILNYFSTAIASYCCKGYCIDLLKELSKTINFTYSVALSPDGQFGSHIIRNSSSEINFVLASTYCS